MKRKQHFEKPFMLYHLSSLDLNGQTLQPRKMDRDRVMEGEDWWSKRICVSTSIDGALSSLASCMACPFGKKFYVHTLTNLDELFMCDKVYKPLANQVPDAEATGEHWLKAPALMKCIGKVEIVDLKASSSSQMIDEFEWKWVEKKEVSNNEQ